MRTFVFVFVVLMGMLLFIVLTPDRPAGQPIGRTAQEASQQAASNRQPTDQGHLVIGMAHAIDEDRKTLTTFLTENDIRSLWSRPGWRNKHVAYVIHDASVPGKEGQLPYWDNEQKTVTWQKRSDALPYNLVPILTWKVRGLREAAGGGDAAVEFNRVGSPVIQRLLTSGVLVLEGTPPGVRQAYVSSSDEIQANKAYLKTCGAILAGIDKDGFAVKTYDFELRPTAQKVFNFRLMLERPPWYPQYQPGL